MFVEASLIVQEMFSAMVESKRSNRNTVTGFPVSIWVAVFEFLAGTGDFFFLVLNDGPPKRTVNSSEKRCTVDGSFSSVLISFNIRDSDAPLLSDFPRRPRIVSLMVSFDSDFPRSA